MRIAFLGLGKMGVAILKHLLPGNEITVWNRTLSTAEALRGEGVQVAATPREAVKEAEVVFSILLNDAAVEDVFLEQGALKAMHAGAIHACLSTISVASSQRLTEAHQQAGKPFIGAPVFGRPHVAEAGKLWSVLAGEDASLARLRPLVERYSRGVTVVGRQPWSAHAMKVGGNFMITAMIASLTEGFVFAEANGIEPATYLQVVNQGLFQSPFVEMYGGLMLHPPETPGGTIALGEKDARLFLEAARGAHVPAPLAHQFHEHLKQAMAEGMQDADWAGGYYQLAKTVAGRERGNN
jgi:3-hydroxyisobutyrate dehydrogenase-like beta-hydroxyacid dehydrogenase